MAQIEEDLCLINLEEESLSLGELTKPLKS
jgi:hypothetical protein